MPELFYGTFTYNQLDLQHKESITINNNGVFSITLDNSFIYRESHLIAEGTWKRDKNILILQSVLKSIDNTAFTKKLVEEGMHGSADSLYIFINNEVENNIREKKIKNRHINYYLSIRSSDRDFNFKYSDKIYHTDKIILERTASPRSFYFVVVPDSYAYPGPINLQMALTEDYRVKDQSSNYFKITLPEITYDFISQRRMEGELMLIKDRNTIFWDGKYFKRVE
jgi:hypothetical protein